MQNPFLHPGKGQPLRLVTASTGNKVSDASTPEALPIPDGIWSETIAGHDCLELMFLFEFDAAATGSMIIEEVLDAEASVAGETFDTVTVTGERVARWNSGEALPGFYRVKNMSGQTAVIYAQKRIN